MHKHTTVVLLLLLLFAGGCNIEKMGSQLSNGLKKNTREIGRNTILGAGDGLADSLFQQRLHHLLDSVLATAGTKGAEAAGKLLDSLLSERWPVFVSQLVEEATGRQLRRNLSNVTGDLQLTVTNLLGPANREQLRLLVATALSEITNERLRLAAAGMREELTGEAMRSNLGQMGAALLNDKTNAAIKAIVDTAMLTIAYRMRNDVKDAVGENASFIQRYAGRLLLLMGAIALIIIVVVWRLKQKYARMTTVLASQIYAIPDQTAYDDLTSRIKEKATIAGIEPTLRKMLEENGLLGKESRESWQTKKAAMLQNKN